MCWQCDNPDKSVDDYLDYVAEEIEKHGWIVQSVEGTRYVRTGPIRSA